ncbi:MAG: Holliday junction branch migration protein RuvA [Treponema sp.]
MFNSISGTLTGKFPKQIHIDTHGIEWAITVPDVCLDELPAVGQETRVYTWLSHTENGMDLYGFARKEERDLFFDLLKVDGIGAKGAIKIMSGVSASQLVSALDAGNLDVLEKINGIGKKTAAKMMLALKGKLTLPENSAAAVQSPAANEYAVVIDSLCSMGYERSLCADAVSKIAAQLASDASFAKKSRTEKEDIVFKKSLMEMAQ